jgi:hypothetical protein
MPIARALGGGLVQSIFSSPSRITICDHAELYCRDAKLKMLCIIRLDHFVVSLLDFCTVGPEIPQTRNANATLAASTLFW